MAEPLWNPRKKSGKALTDLQSFAGSRDFSELHKFSVDNPDAFWSYLARDSQIIGELGELAVSGEGFFATKFFPSAQVNIVDSLLQGDPNQLVITDIAESGTKREFTRKQVRKIANQVAHKLQSSGVTEGDVVAAFSANVAEVVFLALGALKLGAIFSSTSADFGAATVLDRFAQIKPKILLVSQSYQYGGKEIDCREKITEIVSGLPTLTQVVTTQLVSEELGYTGISFQEWITDSEGEIEISIKGGFNRPGFILFSSGTTGKPKCIVHSAMGVLVKILSEQRYHLGIEKNDRVFYFTTCGWMMWNWLVASLAAGAHIFLFDGNPLYPKTDRLFDLADQESITFLGVSAKYIDSIRKENLSPVTTHTLTNLRTIASTGSPLSSESFKYIYEKVSKEVHLASISGGTDICGCFLLGWPDLPVYAGEIQVPALGVDLQIFTEEGERAAVGEKGDLVVLNAFPSTPLFFWDDSENRKYLASYFEKFSGVWTHGDFIEATDQSGYVIHGRSDATLNVAGVRIGTAEIYRIAQGFDEVVESLAIAQKWDGDTRAILFLKLREGAQISEDLVSRMKVALREKASPRHVPALILQAPDLPRTRSNKLVEMAVAQAVNKEPIINLDSLANPESITWFTDLNL